MTLNQKHKINTLFISKPLDVEPISSQYNTSIFQNKQHQFEDQYSDKHQGPKFDQNGKIVRHSLVGNPDWFLKKQIKKVSQNFLSTQALIQPTQYSHRQKNYVDEEEIQNNIRLSANNYVDEVQIINNPNISIKKRQKQIKQYQIVNKTDLINDFNDCEKRVQTIESQSNKKLSQFQLSERNLLTRQGRAIQKYQENERKWTESMVNLQNKTNRPKEQLLFSTLDNWRKKQEQLDQQQSKFCPNRHWYLSLRNPDFKELNKKNLDDQDLRKKIPIDHYLRTEIGSETNCMYFDKRYKQSIMIFKQNVDQKEQNNQFIRVDGVNKLKQEKKWILQSDNQQNFQKFQVENVDQSKIEIKQMDKKGKAKGAQVILEYASL